MRVRIFIPQILTGVVGACVRGCVFLRLVLRGCVFLCLVLRGCVLMRLVVRVYVLLRLVVRVYVLMRLVVRGYVFFASGCTCACALCVLRETAEGGTAVRIVEELFPLMRRHTMQPTNGS